MGWLERASGREDGTGRASDPGADPHRPRGGRRRDGSTAPACIGRRKNATAVKRLGESTRFAVG
jgi:hypothetical protein